MRKPVAMLLVLSLSLLAACGGGATDAAGPGTTQGAPLAGELPTTIEVVVTDRFSVRPNPIVVPAGVPVTFVVRNVGTLHHEIYVGDAAAHAAHDAEMLATPLPEVDPALGVIVPPGETRELILTFDAAAGPLIAGCHIPSHYSRGMKANITIVG